MRAFAAIFIFAVWLRYAHAHNTTDFFHNIIPRVLSTVFKIKNNSPVKNLLNCGQILGPSKCLYALSVWRAENALENFAKIQEPQFSLAADIKEFPWKKFSNSSNEQLYSQLCDGTERLMRHRSLSLSLPGYFFELESKGNGTLNIDIFQRNEAESGRSTMKKLQKQFYRIVPFLLVPGLIMSAILPFVLPSLKMMVMAVGMLNNMALTGAVFTLLRNNAFNDHYDHKVVYVNKGYKNEKYLSEYYKELQPTEFDNIDDQTYDYNDEYTYPKDDELRIKHHNKNRSRKSGHKVKRDGRRKRKNHTKNHM